MARHDQPCSVSHRRRRSTAFTLVELLVVIGLIAVLIGLLMPSLKRAKQSAQRTQCLAQMDQLGKAMQAYAAENLGRTPFQVNNSVYDFASLAVLNSPDPNNRSVLAYLLRYINNNKRLFVCPVASEYTWSGSGAPTADSDTGYMVNAVIVGKPLTKIRRSSEVVAMQEDRFRWSHAWMRPAVQSAPNQPNIYLYWTWNNTGGWGPGTEWGQEYTSVHYDGGNLLFADGHSEWRRHKDLRAKDFGLTSGPGVGGNPNDNSTTVHGQTYLSEFE